MSGQSLAGIDGLLLECSPCRTIPHGHRVIVESLPDPLSHVRRREHANGQHYTLAGGGLRHGSELELRLDTKTGRCHAAWYVYGRLGEAYLKESGNLNTIDAARFGLCMHPVNIERLRGLVLLAAKETT